MRRTDKLIHEAKAVDVTDYMKHVHAWFDLNIVAGNLNENDERKVFVATDEAKVLEELKQRLSIPHLTKHLHLYKTRKFRS